MPIDGKMLGKLLAHRFHRIHGNITGDSGKCREKLVIQKLTVSDECERVVLIQ